HIRGRSSAVDPGSHRPSEGPLGPGEHCFSLGPVRADFNGAVVRWNGGTAAAVCSAPPSGHTPAPHGDAPKARDLTARTRVDQSSMFSQYASFPRCASSSDTVERSSPRFHKLARSADRSDRHTLARMGIGASTRLIGCWVGRRPTDVYAKPYFFMSSGL